MKPSNNFFLMENGHQCYTEINNAPSSKRGIWGDTQTKILNMNAVNSIGTKGIHSRLLQENENNLMTAVPSMKKVRSLLQYNKSEKKLLLHFA